MFDGRLDDTMTVNINVVAGDIFPPLFQITPSGGITEENDTLDYPNIIIATVSVTLIDGYA